MRKQYHHRMVGADSHVWDVHKLVRAARALPVVDVPLTQIAELDENWWYQDPDAIPTPRSFADHLKLVDAADLKYPILLCANGRLMDGMHRVVKAVADGRDTIKAVRFDVTPPPDFINASLDDLPYPDKDV